MQLFNSLKKSIFFNLFVGLIYIGLLLLSIIGCIYIFSPNSSNNALCAISLSIGLRIAEMLPFLIFINLFGTFLEIKNNHYIINISDKVSKNIFYNIYIILGIGLNIYCIFLYIIFLIITNDTP